MHISLSGHDEGFLQQRNRWCRQCLAVFDRPLPALADCPCCQPLGMESGTIRDDQLSTFSAEAVTTDSLVKARYNSGEMSTVELTHLQSSWGPVAHTAVQLSPQRPRSLPTV